MVWVSCQKVWTSTLQPVPFLVQPFLISCSINLFDSTKRKINSICLYASILCAAFQNLASLHRAWKSLAPSSSRPWSGLRAIESRTLTHITYAVLLLPKRTLTTTCEPSRGRHRCLKVHLSSLHGGALCFVRDLCRAQHRTKAIYVGSLYNIY
jgi:hypothetical protein